MIWPRHPHDIPAIFHRRDNYGFCCTARVGGGGMGWVGGGVGGVGGNGGPACAVAVCVSRVS